MSIEAMTWALSADVGDPTRKLILIGQANHAHKDGRNSWASHATIAEYVGCSSKTVQRHVKVLLAEGWIREGDQAQVAHVRADRRPVVYDLAMTEATRRSWAAAHADETLTEDLAGRGDNLSTRPEGTTGQAVTPSTGHGVTDGWTPGAPRVDTAVSTEPSRTPELPPNPPQSGGRSCTRHTDEPGVNCRACGTTARQLETARDRLLAEQRRQADRAALEADRARRATAVPLPTDLKAQARNRIHAARAGATR